MTLIKTEVSKKIPRKGIQVIARAASVLRVLENEPNGLNLGQIAQRVNLSRSTVQRITEALAKERLLMGASPNSGVKLGPSLLRMASSLNFSFVESIRPLITELSRETGETVDVSEMQKNQVVFVDQVLSPARLSIISNVGEAFPLYCLASGKAMLSTLSDADLKKRIGDNTLDRHTSSTITDIDDLIIELAKVRKNHIAFDREEHLEGVSAIGTPIHEPGGKLYAISIPVPAIRFKRKKKQLIKALLEYRERILEVTAL